MADDVWRRSRPDEFVDTETFKVFRSLLGGVAWMVQTRPDAVVYISCLQRHMDKPRAIDVVNLNRVLKFMKRKPLSLTFRAVENPWVLLVISDSAFQSKEQDCLALRSGIIALASKTASGGKYIVQPIEFLCKKQNHV